MKKLFIFAVAFIAFTGFTFSGKKDQTSVKSNVSVTTAKAEHEFDFFRIHRQGKSDIMLSWGINSPAGVSSFTVQRSYDGDFFEEINQAPCNNSVKFSFKDEGVYPGYIYYRVGCIMSDGSCHYSDTEMIRIVSRR